jgi:putative DNA primase/helicase
MRCHRFSAEAIANALDGRPSGEGWVACCPAHDDTTPSLSINETSAGKVLVKCFARCPQATVIAALQKLGLWATPRGRTQPMGPDGVADRRAQREASEAQHRSWAIAIANRIRPAPNTLVPVYLDSRGGLPLPDTRDVGFIASLRHRDQARGEITSWPAMVCRMRTVEGLVMGVHRTWLTPDGLGKAPVDKPRMTLGPCAGCAIQLFEGADTLGISEGIENALAYHVLTGIPVWAAGSTSGLRTIELPTEVRIVVIIADADPAGEKAARVAAMRLTCESRKVRIARPPDGLDFNDLLRRRRAA